LSNADLTSANLEEADLSKAILDDAELAGVRAPGANLREASLIRCNARNASFARADLSGVDARHANFEGADFEGAALTGAKVFGIIMGGAKLSPLAAEWVDASSDGDGTRRVSDADVAPLLLGKGLPANNTRYFGQGDVLRNATLEFGAGSTVEIESRFEKCSIALGTGTSLVIGEAGVLKDCVISGAGDITIHGKFFERESPGIVGPRRLVVSSRGAVQGAVEQSSESTAFSFQPGCRLRMKILRARV
jgi:hypothetical protein